MRHSLRSLIERSELAQFDGNGRACAGLELNNAGDLSDWRRADVRAGFDGFNSAPLNQSNTLINV